VRSTFKLYLNSKLVTAWLLVYRVLVEHLKPRCNMHHNFDKYAEIFQSLPLQNVLLAIRSTCSALVQHLVKLKIKQEPWLSQTNGAIQRVFPENVRKASNCSCLCFDKLFLESVDDKMS